MMQGSKSIDAVAANTRTSRRRLRTMPGMASVARLALAAGVALGSVAACSEQIEYQPAPETYTQASVRVGDDATPRVAARVGDGFFGPNAPLLGRAFAEADYTSDTPAVVLSHAFWQERFNAQPAVIGSNIAIDDVQHTIVGVMPEGFDTPADAAVWLPRR
jgi:hypothetical protein